MNGHLFDFLADSPPSSAAALESGATRLNLAELRSRAKSLADNLLSLDAQRVAIHTDNGIDWVVADLACQIAGVVVIPLPLFFSAEQVQHALESGSVDTVISDRIQRLQPTHVEALPTGTQKITFTSGTTGTPKGVCLSLEQQLRLAQSLATVIGLEAPRHLCVLPLSTLLENLAGVYAPLLAGGTVVVPSLADVGLAGSSGLDVNQWLACIERHQPNSLILVPEMLNALTLAAGAGWQVPDSLQFVAVGGGKVAPQMLHRARELGIPAFEGYGLSECASVVCLNVPGAALPGAVGRPLPHVAVTTEDNEIVVRGNSFLGYVGQPDSWGSDTVRTGDIGYIDADGFVHVNGRRKHQLISSFGRNVSPEWVESELLAGPLLQQAVIIGDDRPYCVALIVPRDPSCTDAEIAEWIRATNLRLPDYARVLGWRRLPRPLSHVDGLLTDNGRPKRSNIESTYQAVIDDMYEIRKEVSGL
jgi:long-subunit acyl-CoA synthetase (AMP-forming)